MDRNGRGFAKDIDVLPDSKVSLTDVRFTTCPVGNEDWMMQASSLNIDSNAQDGVARNVTMRFKDVPIFYTPYISFPVGDERKSGLLFPAFGHSGEQRLRVGGSLLFQSGAELRSHADPSTMSARGEQLGEQFRYLTASSHGQIEGTFLPDDSQTHDDRSYVHFTDITDSRSSMRFDTDIASVSDSDYFEDFSVGSGETSVTFLERRADLLYYDDVWRIRGELQNFQTIDMGLPTACTTAQAATLPTAYCDERPYSRVPRIQANALWPVPDTHFEFALESESVNFLREVGPTGVRFNVSPEMRWSIRGPGYFFEPAVGYDFTAVRFEECRRHRPRRSQHADPGAALCAAGHRPRVRPRGRLAGTAHADSRATLGLQLRALPQSKQFADLRHRAARPESDGAVSHQSLRGRGPHRRCEPAGAGPDHPAVRQCIGSPVPVGDHRSDPLFLRTEGGLPEENILENSGNTLVTVPGLNPTRWRCPGRRS